MPLTSRRIARRGCIAVMIALFTAIGATPVVAQPAQRTLVTSAAVTLADFLSDPKMTWLKENLPHATAVLIAPDIPKVGLIVGGSGGRAVAMARDPDTGRWLGPVFYTLATASVGLQAGISVSQIVTLVMTNVGLRRLLSGSSFEMGADVAIAAGPVGRGARTGLIVDFVSYSRSQGVFIGADLTGTVIATADDWNRIYYGRTVNPSDILVRNTVSNRQARELRDLLAQASVN